MMLDKPCVAALFFMFGASASPMFILLFGAFGIHGNGIVTASFLVLSICGVAFFGTTKGLRVGIADVPLFALVACAGISFALNPLVAPPKDIVLLIMTLAAFPAARLLGANYVPFIRQALFWGSAIVVAIGVVVTVRTLVSGWIGDELARPIVFGFENAATAFSLSLSLLVLAFLTSEPVLLSPKGLATTVLISVSTAVFAASVVRFTLLALLASLAICFILSVRDRRLCLTLGLVISLSIVVGLLSRPASSAAYIGFAFDGLKGFDRTTAFLSSDLSNTAYCRAVNIKNSIEIRRVLLLDAIQLMPKAGLIGLGLDSFAVLGCFKGFSPHNDVLQVIVEFGWLGGASFLALIALPLILLFGPAHADRDVRFVFLLCAFLIMLSMIYGRLNSEIMLFMALGLAGGLVSARGAPGNRTDRNSGLAVLP